MKLKKEHLEVIRYSLIGLALIVIVTIEWWYV